jgi:hypothetical protein
MADDIQQHIDAIRAIIEQDPAQREHFERFISAYPYIVPQAVIDEIEQINYTERIVERGRSSRVFYQSATVRKETFPQRFPGYIIEPYYTNGEIYRAKRVIVEYEA